MDPLAFQIRRSAFGSRLSPSQSEWPPSLLGDPGTGSYETDVQLDLEAIVRERVETLWDQGVSGADLVIACVGAGLRAFTRFARVEYANGAEVPAERFLTEVESVVLDSILGRLSKEVGGQGTSLAGVDPATRFYTLWRYTYRAAELDAGCPLRTFFSRDASALIATMGR